jgi:hypothetical protein
MSGFPAPWRHDAASEEKTMARRPRRNQSPAFNAKVAVAAIKDEKTLIKLAQDSTFTRTRSSSGAISCLKARPGFSATA